MLTLLSLNNIIILWDIINDIGHEEGMICFTGLHMQCALG